MCLRLLFAVLITINIAVAAWLLAGRQGMRSPDATGKGIPVLGLLSDRSIPAPVPTASANGMAGAVAASSESAPVTPRTSAGAANGMALADASKAAATRTVLAPPVTVEPAALSPSPVRGAAVACMSYGPLATPQDLRAARSMLGARVARTRARQEQQTQSHGWWVHLPPAADRQAALEQVRQLAARHITDFFITGSGDTPSTVSLGLFKDPANAHRRRDEIVAAGFPAQLTERVEAVPQYWIDVVSAPGNRLDHPLFLRGTPVGSHSTACF